MVVRQSGRGFAPRSRTRYRFSTPLTGAELGRVMGHETVVHVALAAGRLATSIAIEAGRLGGIRPASPSQARELSPGGA